MHEAVKKGNSDFVLMLIDYGADKELKNVVGKTPRQYAIDNENDTLVTLLS